MCLLACGVSLCWTPDVHATDVELVRQVDGQPLAASTRRLAEALTFLGSPLPSDLITSLDAAQKSRDAVAIQELLDPHVMFVVSLNPEVRVKVRQGPAKATLQQGGFMPHLVKVINDSTVSSQLRIASPQAGNVYSGTALAILKRQAQTELKDEEDSEERTDTFLSVEMFQRPPMTEKLSGLKVEYAIALIYSSESGKREATIKFDVGPGTQDIGFRGEAPVLFEVQPAVPVKLAVRDHDGQPTVARLTIRDRFGRIYPSQAKRLAPDFFFQPQIYRNDGDVVLLPPGEFQVEYSRGPEYRVLHTQFTVKETDAASTDVVKLPLKLARWINPTDHGFYGGDHHIHGAGCSHYEMPTQGVTPEDMYLQVKGEGLNVGCILTWGPCFDFQRNYFSPTADKVSDPFTVLKYDIEVSGFGSAALGHVCLLNLKDQEYPGSNGSKEKGWPTWTVPVLRWCKEQGGVTGYPHSAMHVIPPLEAKRILAFDSDESESVDKDEVADALLPEPFETIDEDRDGFLTSRELTISAGRAADQLPNLAVPSMGAGGAMEICVSTAEGVCDFISAMDTARIPEWNTWYHLMNCGFPLKLSGETDFPCMSSRRVGQGRVYVQLGEVDQVDYTDWCNGIAAGRSYVSDGFAHAPRFEVSGQSPGFDDVLLDKPGSVNVKATVAFAPETPVGVAYGNLMPSIGRRMLGDTINLHAPRSMEYIRGGRRKVELIVNGQAVSSVEVPADGQMHEIKFTAQVDHSSWIALRHFPQLHTNPVNVLIGNKPIRASRDSARWCIETIHLLWKNRHERIAKLERPAARAAYDRAIARYEQIAREAAP
jgi:hypothetical protein